MISYPVNKDQREDRGFFYALKRGVKTAVGFFFFRTGLYKHMLKGKAVVALFHKVNRSALYDHLNCPPDRFRSFCSFFRKYLKPVTLSEIVERLNGKGDFSGEIAVTFDDGYKDNYTIAAPELRSKGMPACFFITTSFIGTNHQPSWDEVAHVKAEWMTWDEVRSLVADGFEIGSHTMSHADLGVVRGPEAEREISGSMERITKELGRGCAHFSFPFGGWDNITEENISAVKKAGYRDCLSAFGGIVASDDDPHRLLRMPVLKVHLSPYHFGYDILFNNWR